MNYDNQFKEVQNEPTSQCTERMNEQKPLTPNLNKIGINFLKHLKIPQQTNQQDPSQQSLFVDRSPSSQHKLVKQSKFIDHGSGKLVSSIIVNFHCLSFLKKLRSFIRQDPDSTIKHHNLLNDIASSYKPVNQHTFQKKAMVKYQTMIVATSPIVKFMNECYIQLKASIQGCFLNLPLIQANNQLKHIWDIMMLLLRIFIIITVPLMMAVPMSSISQMANIDYSIYGLFLTLDIFMRTITITFNQGLPVTDRKQILSNQLNIETLIELAGSILLIMLPFIDNDSFIFQHGQIKLLLLLEMPQIKVVLISIQSKQEQLNLNKQNMSITELIKLIALIFFIQHYCSCIWLILGQYCQQIGTANWISENQFSETEYGNLYLQSLYFISVTMFTVGYGDIHPQSISQQQIDSYEKVFTILFMFLCTFQLSYSVNTIGSILTQLRENNELMKNKLTAINQFMQSSKISQSLQIQVREYFIYYYKQQIQQQFDQGQLFEQLPQDLQMQIQIEAASQLLNRCNYFKKNFSPKCIQQLLSVSRFQNLQPGVLINNLSLNLTSDDHFLCIIKNGSIGVYQNDTPLTQLNQYQYFGLNEFIQNQRTEMQYKATQFTTVLIISYLKFREILSIYEQDQEAFFSTQVIELCYICGNNRHSTLQCKLCHFKPDKEKAIKQYLYHSYQNRRQYVRNSARNKQSQQTFVTLENNIYDIELFQTEKVDDINEVYPEIDTMNSQNDISSYEQKPPSYLNIHRPSIALQQFISSQVEPCYEIELLYKQRDKFPARQQQEIWHLYKKTKLIHQFLDLDRWKEYSFLNTQWNLSEVLKVMEVKRQFNNHKYQQFITNISKYMVQPFDFIWRYKYNQYQSLTQEPKNLSQLFKRQKQSFRKIINRERAKIFVQSTEFLQLPDDLAGRQMPNYISTMQSSWLTFLPLNLAKQLSQPSNLYFIAIGVLQILPGTSYTNGIPVVYAPLLVMMLISMIKDAVEEYSRYTSDQKENHRKAKKFVQSFTQCSWSDLRQGNIIQISEGEVVPCDVLILAASETGGIAYVETKQMDGETNLKQKYSMSNLQSMFELDQQSNYKSQKIKFTFDQPNVTLYKINGSYSIDNQNYPITYGNFIERGCMLQNSKWVICLCIHVGMDCKIMLNATNAKTKQSKLQVTLKYCIVAISLTLLFCCIFASLYAHFWIQMNQYEYLSITMESIITNIGLWFSLLSYFIPISLLVNIELVKFFQGKLLERDLTIKGAQCHQSNLIEQLGEVNYIFSDKTGTLTRNEMVFRTLEASNKYESLLCMALCHSVISQNGKLIGSSPDELAMVEYCNHNGMQFQGIDNQSNMKVNGRIYRRLITIPFTSEKKRMTILIQTGNEYIVYCKGADEVLLPISSGYVFESKLKEFATQGLRTLLLCRRVINSEEAQRLHKEFEEAEEQDSEIAIDRIQDCLEKGMQAIGVSGVEDLLQDQVAETIQSLKDASIKIWVLTGDKIETAISIGYSSALIQNEVVQIINEHSVGTIEEAFMDSNDNNSGTLVVTGAALDVIFDTPQLKQAFLHKALLSKTVIVARVSPKQKQLVVQLIKQNLPNATTLSIGDGANDVSMITEAHIGVGIQGVEGSQAARAADFAITEFKHLRRLLLYYGIECARRNSITVLYIFYKNQVFISPYFWFGMLNGFSGQYLYDQWMQQLFNTVFAAVPQILYALFDEIYPSDNYLTTQKTKKNRLENEPTMYNKIAQFTMYKFYQWIFTGMLQGFVITSFCICLTNDNLGQGRNISLMEVGTLIYASTILLANLKIITFTYTHYNFTIMVLILSILSYWILLIAFDHILASDSYDFYRFIGSPQIYLVLILTSSLFLIDLAYERVTAFQSHNRVQSIIELM